MTQASSPLPSYSVTPFMRNGRRCVRYYFPHGEHILAEPIVLDDFDIIEGAGNHATLIRVIGEFAGPVIRTRGLAENCTSCAWHHKEGVPARFVLQNFTLDLDGWQPERTPYDFGHGDLAACGIGLYGKAYDVRNVSVINSPGSAFISIGSTRGGKIDPYLDSPEAKISGLEISKTQHDSFIFAGPHDALLDNIIVSISKAKGVLIIGDSRVNGACDIGYIHSYATDDIAIDIQAKVKARFLQGDTGTKAGVSISNNNKSVIDMIETFKTRPDILNPGKESYSLIVKAVETQIGIARIRADNGAHGLYLGGVGNIISNLHICAGDKHSPDPTRTLQPKPTALILTGHANTIVYGRIIDAAAQPIIVDQSVPVKYFTANLSIDYQKLSPEQLIYDPKDFLESNIMVNNLANTCRVGDLSPPAPVQNREA